MKYLLDVHHIGTRATGNETWARETSLAIVRQAAADEALVFAGGPALATALGDGVSVEHVHASAARRLALDLPRIARRQDVGAVLTQYTAPVTTRPVVLAVHDLSFTAPESSAWIPRPERARMNTTIRWSARRASIVIALSEYTRRDLIGQWGIDPDRIVVAPPAVSPGFRSLLSRGSQARGRSPGLRILIVGNVLPRKNHAVVLRAAQRLRAAGLPVSVRIAGQVPQGGHGVGEDLMSAGGAWTTFTGYLDDAGLAQEYLAADVLCYPSLYEGFGIPVLEAMAAGLPVVASNATALPEAVGSAGMVLDPHDDLVWADALETVLTRPDVASAMVTAGREHEAGFTWSRTSATLLDALRQAAGRA